jgi:hypothetical protein
MYRDNDSRNERIEYQERPDAGKEDKDKGEAAESYPEVQLLHDAE